MTLTVTRREPRRPSSTRAEGRRGGHESAPERPGASGHHDHAHTHAHLPDEGPWWRSQKVLLTFACGLSLGLAFALGKIVPEVEPWAFTAAMVVGLVPIAWRAAVAARAGRPFSIETLMTIAAVGAVVIGASEEAAAVVFLFLIGELLEGVAAGRARASIRALGKLVPKTALIRETRGMREVPADTLAIGTVIVVRPGDRVPADGVVVAGESAIDEAPITGESALINKRIGDVVFAGTVNGDAVLDVEVTVAAQDNTIARIVKLVEEAQESKAPTERFIDRFSAYYTPGIMVLAGLVAVIPPLFLGGAWDAWIYKGLAILLIGCPCALVISTPAAIAAALASGARRGLLMKGGAVLENIGRIDVAAFDKTGTLTEGRPKVTDVVAMARPQQDVLAFAAALEAGSSHPLAAAILARATDDKVAAFRATDARAIGGKGVAGIVDGMAVFLGSPRAAAERVSLPQEILDLAATFGDQGKTSSILLVDGEVAGLLAMRDEPRADAGAGLMALRTAGIETVMLTGDNRRTAEAIGRPLDVEVHAGLLPQDKQRIVGELRRNGRSVAVIGDGINDAPALAAADVGVAMGGGTDVALETADAAILHSRVADVAAMVHLSRRAMINIRQNITIAIGLKLVFLVTTIVGLTGLWPAILADTGATILVTVNALRLLRR
jgi:Zn2+/Cd2+-exporting ATPase